MKKSKWILLAEDDAPLAELTTLALAPDELACEVAVARDGLEALDCLHGRGQFQSRAGGNPAFVLLDLKMPKLDGLEVLRQIRSDPELKTIPVVMFTSSREITDVRRSYQLGANAYVVKPGDFREFSAVLKCVGEFWAVVNELPAPAAPVKTDSPQTRAVPNLAVAT
jgi:CheY-like chemotaxis protein